MSCSCICGCGFFCDWFEFGRTLPLKWSEFYLHEYCTVKMLVNKIYVKYIYINCVTGKGLTVTLTARIGWYFVHLLVLQHYLLLN